MKNWESWCWATGTGRMKQLWLDAPQAENGYLTPNDAPGFGLRLNEELM